MRHFVPKAPYKSFQVIRGTNISILYVVDAEGVFWSTTMVWGVKACGPWTKV